MKVICTSSDVVKDGLKSGTKLHGSPYNISVDQTKMQEEAYMAARKELEARKAAGEVNLVIRYNSRNKKIKKTV